MYIQIDVILKEKSESEKLSVPDHCLRILQTNLLYICVKLEV